DADAKAQADAREKAAREESKKKAIAAKNGPGTRNWSIWRAQADMPGQGDDGAWLDLETGIAYDPAWDYEKNRAFGERKNATKAGKEANAAKTPEPEPYPDADKSGQNAEQAGPDNSALNFNTYIAISADSLERLRKIDVERVLSEAPASDRVALGDYIIAGRSDLADEVREVLTDLQSTALTPDGRESKVKTAKDPQYSLPVVPELIAAGFTRVMNNDYAHSMQAGDMGLRFNIRVTVDGFFLVTLNTIFAGGMTGAGLGVIARTADVGEAIAIVKAEAAKRGAEETLSDPQKKVDRALFQSVIDGTVKTADGEGILSPQLADDMEAAFYRNQGDTEMESLFEQAVNAYQDAMLAATADIK
ncbi:MAG: hypothetical protein ACR2HF_14310, partial [Methylococcaceae bacterium]